MSNSKSDYVLKYRWNPNWEINIDDGLFLGNIPFIEVVSNQGIFRGESEDLNTAEDMAWEAYQKTLICEHELKRVSDSGYAKCIKCDYAGNFLEDLEVCKETDCNSNPVGYIGYKNYCLKHFIEKAEESINNGKTDSPIASIRFIKKQLIFVKVLSQMGLIEQSSDKNTIKKYCKNLFLRVNENIHEVISNILQGKLNKKEITLKEFSKEEKDIEEKLFSNSDFVVFVILYLNELEKIQEKAVEILKK